MPNAPNYELAENDYMSGMKYKDIARKYGVTLNTVKSWKKRYNWDRKGVYTKNEKVCTQKQSIKSDDKKPVADEVEAVLQNTELTEKQRLFCLYFVKCFNATKAYRKAYQCDEYVAMSSGSRLLRNAKVKEEIDRLKQEKLNQAYLTQADIFQKYMDIAFADMGDYVTFGKKKVPVWKRVDGQDIPVMDPNTGQQKIAEYSYVDLKESTGVDTSIISEVSEGKNGIKIKRADQMKALQWLTEHMDMATQEQKARLELLKLQKEKLSEGTAENDEAVEKMDNISKILEQMRQVNQDDLAD